MSDADGRKKTALVCGAGGFIGSHLVRQLVKDGYWVRGADQKHTEFSPTAAHVAPVKATAAAPRMKSRRSSFFRSLIGLQSFLR